MTRFAFYLLLLCCLSAEAQNIRKKQAPLMTPWANDVPTSCPLPEYPRPIMERGEWMNLNGIWEFEEAAEGDKLPTQKKLKENILVPYPWESALSGIQRQLDSQRAWYKRTFNLPDRVEGQGSAAKLRCRRLGIGRIRQRPARRLPPGRLRPVQLQHHPLSQQKRPGRNHRKSMGSGQQQGHRPRQAKQFPLQ